MIENTQPKPVKTTSWVRQGVIGAILVLVAFLLGFVPMWSQSHACSISLSEAQDQLDLARMQNALASAAIYARQGEYETARQAASDFFTSVRAETDKGDAASLLSLAQREEVQPLIAQRDGIITLLARGDPAAADRLSDLYGAYREIVKGPTPTEGSAED